MSEDNVETGTSPAALDRAQKIADLVPLIARERADNDHPSEWTRRQSFDDYVYMLRSIEARVDDTPDGPVVVVWARMRPDGDYWTETVSAVLDTAADRVDTAEGDDVAFTYGHIHQDEGSYEARLTMPKRVACVECGAKPDEECLEYNCQGSWDAPE